MSETLSVADVLRKALEAFGPNGENWVQGTNKALTAPNCCVNTAFSRIEPVTVKLLDKTTKFLLKAGGFKCGTASMRWNDAPERTFAEVKALFEKAIAKAGTQ